MRNDTYRRGDFVTGSELKAYFTSLQNYRLVTKKLDALISTTKYKEPQIPKFVCDLLELPQTDRLV